MPKMSDRLPELKLPDMSKILAERNAVANEAGKELSCIAQTKGWQYAQRVALEIQNDFACKPTDPGWQTYTTIQYALRQFFDRCRVMAVKAEGAVIPGQSILAEIKEKNASNRDSSRRNKPASTTKPASRRKAAS